MRLSLPTAIFPQKWHWISHTDFQGLHYYLNGLYLILIDFLFIVCLFLKFDDKYKLALCFILWLNWLSFFRPLNRLRIFVFYQLVYSNSFAWIVFWVRYICCALFSSYHLFITTCILHKYVKLSTSRSLRCGQVCHVIQL